MSTEANKAETNEEARGSRRVIVGTITSAVNDKTITVTVIRRVRDRRFHKFLTRRVKYHVHDENNVGNVGDLVEIIESRPMSRTKRWRLFRTITKAVTTAAGAEGAS